MTPYEAALLIQADYQGVLPDALVLERLDIDYCQCVILAPVPPITDTILLIRGSDERQDWRKNFDWLPMPGPGDRYWWHRGFLSRAQVAYSFAKNKGVTLVIGHSLGAACTQIVCLGLNVPGMAFASPKVHWCPSPWAEDIPTASLVTNYCRVDDLVCYVPPDGFDHVGKVDWLTPASRHPGTDHAIQFYAELLAPPSVDTPTEVL